MTKLMAWYIALLGLFFLSAPKVIADANAELLQLAQDYWDHELYEDPLRATANGVHDYNHRLPQVADADQRRRLQAARQFARRLRRISRDALSASNQINADLLAFILDHRIALAEFRSWRMPILSDYGFHQALLYIVRETPFRTHDDYQAYLQRLKALPEYFAQNIANMRLGLEEGFTQPQAILPGIIDSFEVLQLGELESHPLYQPFLQFPEAFSSSQRASIQREAERLFRENLAPSFAQAAAFMKNEYLPGAMRLVGASHWPEGNAYYQALVRFYTSLDDARPDDIHALGIREVSRIRQEMQAVIEQTDFTGNFREFLAFLRTDQQFYARTPRQLLAHAAWLAKDIDGRLPGYFGKLPRQPYSVEPVPDEVAPNYTTGRYVGAALSASIGGQYWVNTYALDTRPLYQLPALTLHEAVPGHHLQAALALELENVPAFRRDFYPHAFGEGWGLYAEKLGVEMGVYTTPYEHFGRLSYEMWRACRLVIDTGLHASGWSREQAIEYLATNTALSEHNVRTEVDRYIAWPGQALAYKVGELTLWELRQQAESALGEQFDIRGFHDAVLAEGALPLELLRQQIKAYIVLEKERLSEH